MVMNKQKSGIMKVKQRTREKLDHGLLMGVPIVDSYKFLGVMLNDSLKVKPHINLIKEKISNFMKLGRKIHRMNSGMKL